MSDIATIWNVTYGDWQLVGADLATDQDLYTSILISLATDARAAPDDFIPGGAKDPRGWWADAYADRPIGSKIWLLPRVKAPQTLVAARKAVLDALQWLIDDGVVASFDVITQFLDPVTLNAPLQLGAQITVHRQGKTPASVNYQWVWGQIG